MPANQQSLLLADRYRDALSTLRARGVRGLEAAWSTLDLADIDTSYRRWLAAAVPTVGALQSTGVTLTSRYLTAYLTSELGEQRLVTLDSDPYVGRDRFERPLERALTPPVMTVKMALSRGHRQRALLFGLNRAKRLVAEAVIAAPRRALADAIREHPDIDGWRRVTSGTCAACEALAGNLEGAGIQFPVHDHCQCIQAPSVAGAPENFAFPVAAELFADKSEEEQDEVYGPERAQLIRDGLPVERLIERQEMALGGTVITERPVKDLR